MITHSRGLATLPLASARTAVPLEGWSWSLVVDTGHAEAMIQQPSEASAVGRQIDVGARSVMVLEGRAV